MTLLKNSNTVLAIFFTFTVYVTPAVHAQENFRVSYGAYETAAPMWVCTDEGFFRKYGIGASMIQMRSGALSIAAGVQIGPAPCRNCEPEDHAGRYRANHG